MQTEQPISPKQGQTDGSDWAGGAQLEEHECIKLEPSPMASSVSAALAGVPTGESISRAAFSGEAVCETDVTEISGVFEGLLGEAGVAKPRRFGSSSSHRLRDTNRMNTAQLMAQAGLSSSQRLWILTVFLILGAGLIVWKWVI